MVVLSKITRPNAVKYFKELRLVESIESQYINISTYRPLLGSSNMNLPTELKYPKKRTNQHQKRRSKTSFMV